MTWKRAANGKPVHQPGALFKEWLVFRALTIRDFFEEARQSVKQVDPKMTLGTYTGSWYGDYWNEGLNWGSPDYDASKDYAWAPAEWKRAGYANLLDVLFSGLYFRNVTVEDARAAGSGPAQSVEGGAELLKKVVDSATKYVGGLNLPDYKDKPGQFVRAARMCLDKTAGLMVFDLVYLDEYGWWQQMKEISAAAPAGEDKASSSPLAAKGAKPSAGDAQTTRTRDAETTGISVLETPAGLPGR
jgi:hypothetical protein